MAKKTDENKPVKTEKAKPEKDKTASPEQVFIKPQRLTVGVNFLASPGAKEETRVESGVIEAGTLPPAFEQLLRERKLLFDLK